MVGDDDHGVEAGSRAAHEAVEVSLSAGVIVVLLALLCVAADCGFRSGDKGLYDPCTRDYECRPPLICRTGACADAGMPQDAGMDAATDAATVTDSSVMDASALD